MWVDPWNFEQTLAFFRDYLRKMESEIFLNYRIIQATPEYTIPENVVKISRMVWEQTVNE